MRYFYLVTLAGVVRADASAFTYHADSPLAIGTLVRVSVGTRLANGIVLEAIKQKPSFKTKPINEVLASRPLPKQLLELANWLGDYYVTHMGLVLQTLLPSGLHKVRRSAYKSTAPSVRNRAKIVLNKDQLLALKLIRSSKSSSFLLHGVTGSGKTQVYIEAAKHQARQGKSSIILVPEIALTPQLVAEFAQHFPRLLVTHSKMTETQRHQVWLNALSSDEPMVVIGPRSALFMPLNTIGLVVVDECHEPSYKQEQSPRYSALRAASILAKAHGARLIFGSATPSVSDYYLAQANKYPILKLSKTANATQAITIKNIDYKKRDNFRKHHFISDALYTSIEQALAAKQQILLFHNRRGTAPTTLCDHCGWIAECPTCFLPLTLHADTHELRCHVCMFKQVVRSSCPACHEPTITFKGIGTKLIETEVAKLFPKARLARFDADTEDQNAIHNQYQALYNGDIDIMIGTQVLAKGLDLPKLTVVGVIQADSGLIIPDYQADERVFQLLYQVMGRVGRGILPGTVVIQTYQPEHPIIQAAIARDYQQFYRAEINKRTKSHFPPFRFILKLTCSYKTENGAVEASRRLGRALHANPHIEVLGPAPAFYERQGGAYRWQLIIKAKQRSELQAIAKQLPANWQFDLDPASLL